MTDTASALDTITVASPCTQDWGKMTGDERVRHCSLCKLNVYNLSDMTSEDAEELVASREGRLCVRFYRRADGTVITRDCATVLARMRRRAKIIAVAFLGALGLSTASAAIAAQETGGLKAPATWTRQPFSTIAKVLPAGWLPEPEPEIFMGEACIIPYVQVPTPPPAQDDDTPR